MDLRKVKKLIELFEESSLDSISIEEEKGEKIKLKRNQPVYASDTHEIVHTNKVEKRQPQQSKAESEPEEHKGEPVKSPIVGTFYSAASPTSKPFVTVGERVNKGDVVCIIEAMKMMNNIKAPKSGIVTAVVAKNEQAVEYGQELLYIE